MKNYLRIYLYTLILSWVPFTALNAVHKKMLNETEIRVQPGQTIVFKTEQSRIHSKFDIKHYELEESPYLETNNSYIHLSTPTYELKIGKHAHPGNFTVVGKNEQGDVKTITPITIISKKEKDLDQSENFEVKHAQPGQTLVFKTQAVGSIPRVTISNYILESDEYHQDTHHEIHLYPPTYELTIDSQAQPGIFKVVGKNDVGVINMTKKIIVEQKREKKKQRKN